MYFYIFLLTFYGVLAQKTFEGPCKVDKAQLVTSVKAEKMLGLWYQRERIPSPIDTGECSIHVFSGINQYTGIVSHLSQFGDSVRGWYGFLHRDIYEPYKFHYSYGELKFDTYILATNYDDYALLYSCVNTGNNSRHIYAWTLTRTLDYFPDDDDQATKKLMEVLEHHEDISDVNIWEVVNHTNCDNLKIHSLFPVSTVVAP